MRSRRRASQAMTGMNLTSLLDITFCLLIAFMVVAPALTRNMEIELPEAKPPDNAPVVQDPKETVQISVIYGGTPEGPHPLQARGETLSGLEELENLAAMWKKEALPVSLEIDWRVPYGNYIQVAAALGRAGITKYNLVYQEPRR